MKTTENYGFPYPECNPPLVKDASQIVQVRNLADAVDAAVQDLADRGDRAIVTPQAVRVSQTAAVASTANVVVPVFNSIQFNPYGMTIGINGEPYLNEAGWWLVGAYVNADSATPMNNLLRFTLNDTPASSWSDESAVYVGTLQLPYASTVLRVEQDDRLNIEVMHRQGGAPSWTHRAFLWASKVIAA